MASLGAAQRRQVAGGDGREAVVDVEAGQVGASTARLGDVAQEVRLQVNASRLPHQADGAAGEGDVVARLDAVEVLEEEAATGVHPLPEVLRLQQIAGAALVRAKQRPLAALAVTRPELFCRKPAFV